MPSSEIQMKSVVTTFAVLTFAAALSAGSAFAAETKAPTAQQSKMSTCSKSAHDKGLKGDEYKGYMSTCLKADAPAEPAKPMTQQEKMKACNADPKAKTLHGDERKTFMSSCLSGSGAPAH